MDGLGWKSVYEKGGNKFRFRLHLPHAYHFNFVQNKKKSQNLIVCAIYRTLKIKKMQQLLANKFEQPNDDEDSGAYSEIRLGGGGAKHGYFPPFFISLFFGGEGGQLSLKTLGAPFPPPEYTPAKIQP